MTSSQLTSPIIFARPSASTTWLIATIGTASASASGANVRAIQGQMSYSAYSQELPHDPNAGLPDLGANAFAAATLFSIGVCKYRDVFRFSRSLDGADDDPPPG